ncbi:MAG: hypothetical protein IJX72_06110 [Clostridia bacterium]|nr:hypothetical protein [Clostridia bacterium]
MNQNETMETSAVMIENSPEADSASDEAMVNAALLSEAEGVKAVYPDFDLDTALAHPILGALLRGEGKPTLRQLYEAVHMEDIVEGRVSSAVEAQVSRAVESAVAEAVAEAVRECEERLLGHIRARGQRPAENGLSAAAGIRMHPAVDRLTRRERAMLAKRAENGETIKL